MIPIVKELNQVQRLAQKETKAQQSEKEREMNIILEHESRHFQVTNWIWFVVG